MINALPCSFKEHIILKDLPAAHTLEVYDMDLDGDLDLLTGINWARAINLEIDRGDVLLVPNEGDAKKWKVKMISDQGIYNGRVVDYDGDGDYDIFRLPNHEAKKAFLIENLLK